MNCLECQQQKEAAQQEAGQNRSFPNKRITSIILFCPVPVNQCLLMFGGSLLVANLISLPGDVCFITLRTHIEGLNLKGRTDSSASQKARKSHLGTKMHFCGFSVKC